MAENEATNYKILPDGQVEADGKTYGSLEEYFREREAKLKGDKPQDEETKRAG